MSRGANAGLSQLQRIKQAAPHLAPPRQSGSYSALWSKRGVERCLFFSGNGGAGAEAGPEAGAGTGARREMHTSAAWSGAEAPLMPTRQSGNNETTGLFSAPSAQVAAGAFDAASTGAFGTPSKAVRDASAGSPGTPRGLRTLPQREFCTSTVVQWRGVAAAEIEALNARGETVCRAQLPAAAYALGGHFSRRPLKTKAQQIGERHAVMAQGQQPAVCTKPLLEALARKLQQNQLAKKQQQQQQH